VTSIYAMVRDGLVLSLIIWRTLVLLICVTEHDLIENKR
jgi:hypothetical protein